LLQSIPNTTKAESRILSASEYQELLDGKAYVAFYGRISYFDIFGTFHWVNFCGFGSPSSKSIMVNTKKCVDYNDIDNN
jgi:hypothetical protein